MPHTVEIENLSELSQFIYKELQKYDQPLTGNMWFKTLVESVARNFSQPDTLYVAGNVNYTLLSLDNHGLIKIDGRDIGLCSEEYTIHVT